MLKVESLKAKHLPMLALSEQTERIGWMQIMLIKTWLAEAETKLKGLIPKRQPRCLVALENHDLISLIVLQPNNRRGTCWSISLPIFIKDPINQGKQEVSKLLLKEALEQEKNIVQSWIIKCKNSDTQNLSLLREVGFQPLKLIKNWAFTSSSTKNISKELKLPSSLSWEFLSKTNAQILWRLKNISQSVQLREMLDGQWIDLLDKNQPENGILINNDKNQRSAILGAINPIYSEDLLSLELIRDLAWDSRLEEAVPQILDKLRSSQQYISIETSVNDQKLNAILKDLGWVEKNESILLGRSLWKRKLNNRSILGERAIESILGSLKPNQTPLPSPIIDTD